MKSLLTPSAVRVRLTGSGWLSRIVRDPVDSLTEKIDGKLLVTLTRPDTACPMEVKTSSSRVPSLKVSAAVKLPATEPCIPLSVSLPDLKASLSMDATTTEVVVMLRVTGLLDERPGRDACMSTIPADSGVTMLPDMLTAAELEVN